jgi:hypothetical protein
MPADGSTGREISQKDVLKASGQKTRVAFCPCSETGENSGMSSVLVRPPPLKS